MSIINQMLKDLEKRKGNKPQESSSSTSGTAMPPTSVEKLPASNYKLFGLIALLVLIVVACLVVLAIHYKQKNEITIALTDQNAKVASQSFLIHELTESKIHQLTKIAANKKKEEAYTLEVFTLHFSTLPHYSVQKNLGTHEVLITLTDSVNSLPIKAVEDTSVDPYTVKTEDKNLVMRVALPVGSDEVSVKSEGTNLILRIKSLLEIEEDDNASSAATSINHEQRQEIRYEEALAQAKQGKLNTAKMMLAALLESNPTLYRVRESLALILLQQKHYEDAAPLLERGLAFNSIYEPFVRLKARVQFELNHPEAALMTLQTISPALKDAPDYYALMAVIEQRQGNYLYAAELYQQLVMIYPKNGVWWLGLAIALQTDNQNNAALEAYQRAIHTQVLKPSIVAFARSQVIALGG
jgi:tetratricopeptide (TPR) repeat protein